MSVAALAAPRPGCFGAASVFNLDSPVCEKCAEFESCRSITHDKLKQMQGMVDVSELLARHEKVIRSDLAKPIVTAVSSTGTGSMAPLNLTIKPPDAPKPKPIRVILSSAEKDSISSMPKKAREEMRKLMERNDDKLIRERLASRENPFPLEGRRYLHVAFDMLLSGGFTRTELRDAYEKRLGWRRGASQSHVSIMLAILHYMNLVQEKDARILLKPATE